MTIPIVPKSKLLGLDFVFGEFPNYYHHNSDEIKKSKTFPANMKKRPYFLPGKTRRRKRLRKQVVLGIYNILAEKNQELHVTKLFYKLQTNKAPQNIQNRLEKEIPIENHQFFGGPMFVCRGEFLGVQNCTWVIVFGSTLVAFHTSSRCLSKGKKVRHTIRQFPAQPNKWVWIC